MIYGNIIISSCQVDKFLDGSIDGIDIVEVELEKVRVFGFLDSICVYSNRPGVGLAYSNIKHGPRRVGAHKLQRDFYGYFMFLNYCLIVTNL